MGSELLIQAFENFRRASSSLEKAHFELNRKIAQLSQKLDEKNRELEKNLEEKEEIRSFLDAILSNMSSGVLVTDRSGRIIITNKIFDEIITSEESEKIRRIVPRSIPNNIMVKLRSILAGKEKIPEITIDGKIFVISCNVFKIRPDSKENIVFVFNNITEIRLLQEERERKSRLSAMGEIAVQLAHEIRNPLAGIQLYVSLMKDSSTNDPELSEWAKNVEAGLAGISYMVTNMLQFYKPIKMNPEFVEPAEAIRESIALLKPVIDKRSVNVHLEDTYGENVIYADREQLKQLSMNLLKNSLNAMQEGGEIKIVVTGPVKTAADDNDPYVFISFQDNGIGMDDEEKQKMFEPFWSSQKGGFGIGMWVCGQIVRQHNGVIKIESEKGIGSVVNVYIPVYQKGDLQ